MCVRQVIGYIRGIPGFYSTSGAVHYTAVIFSAHLVAVKWEIFITTNTKVVRKYNFELGSAAQLTRSPLLPANRIRQSIAHVQRFK